MVLEYAGGELFDYIVQNGRMKEVESRRFFQQMICAVEYCHRHKIVHRDLKPENLLLDENLNVKIADFGLSKVVWNEETMTPCGTVGYTAPEIVKDERYSKSVDMWAMGCVLYTLLCGFPPFYDESINVLTEKVARGYYTFLSPWWDDISGSGKFVLILLQFTSV